MKKICVVFCMCFTFHIYSMEKEVQEVKKYKKDLYKYIDENNEYVINSLKDLKKYTRNLKFSQLVNVNNDINSLKEKIVDISSLMVEIKQNFKKLHDYLDIEASDSEVHNSSSDSDSQEKEGDPIF